MSSRVILGIDPGLVRTGWGVIQHSSDKTRYICSGVIKTSSKSNFSARLIHIYNEISAIIIEYKPQEVAIEEVFVNMNPESSKRLIMAKTSAYLAACNYGLVPFEHSANTVKKNVTGNGHSSKENVHIMIQKILRSPVEKEFSDSIDALAVAMSMAFVQTRELSN